MISMTIIVAKEATVEQKPLSMPIDRPLTGI